MEVTWITCSMLSSHTMSPETVHCSQGCDDNKTRCRSMNSSNYASQRVNDRRVEGVVTSESVADSNIDRTVQPTRRSTRNCNPSIISLLLHSVPCRNYYCYLYIVWIFVWYRQIEYVISQDVGENVTVVPSQSPSFSNTSTFIPSSFVPISAPSTIAPSALLQPTQVPTTKEVTFPPLSLEPTKNLITVISPRLSMTLINMEQNILTHNETRRQFRNLTSQHVRQFWNITSQQYTTPFFIGRVVTSILSETRTPIVPPEEPFILNSIMIHPINNNTTITNSTMESNSVVTLPERLVIVYTQEITYLEQPTGDASFFNFQVSDMFTIPFVEDGLTFTTKLRSLTFNQYIIFLDYTGVVVEETPVVPILSDPKNRKLISSVVTVVVIIILAASLHIYCFLIRRSKIDHDMMQNRDGTNVGNAAVDDRDRPESLLQMNENGELPLLIPPPMSVASASMVTGIHQQQTNSIHSTSTNNHENVIVSENYDEDYTVPDSTTTNPSNTEDQLMHRQNVATAISQPLLPPFLPPLSSMESRHISNITDPTSWGSEQVRSTSASSNVMKNNTFMDRGSPLRITSTSSRDFDSEPFMLNPLNNELNQLSQHHHPLMIGTPSRYGMVTTAIPSTVSDLDMNETPLMSDFQDSPLPTFRRNSEDNNIHTGVASGYEGFGSSSHNNVDPDYTQPPSPLILGLPTLGNGIDDNMLDHNHQQQQQQQHHYYNHYPHEPDHLQQDDGIYQNDTSLYDENRNLPLMTGFQLEIQDLE